QAGGGGQDAADQGRGQGGRRWDSWAAGAGGAGDSGQRAAREHCGHARDHRRAGAALLRGDGGVRRRSAGGAAAAGGAGVSTAGGRGQRVLCAAGARGALPARAGHCAPRPQARQHMRGRAGRAENRGLWMRDAVPPAAGAGGRHARAIRRDAVVGRVRVGPVHGAGAAGGAGGVRGGQGGRVGAGHRVLCHAPPAVPVGGRGAAARPRVCALPAGAGAVFRAVVRRRADGGVSDDDAARVHGGAVGAGGDGTGPGGGPGAAREHRRGGRGPVGPVDCLCTGSV
ncbi:hypothetical protein LPJ70_007561, partial [Coemansia sp. RSA 2708]